MLGIILGILKIIGIVLLVLLGILLTLILLVLFVPVRYRVKGTLDGKPRGMGEISWLLRLISCRVTYEEELDMAVRILGIRVGGNWFGADEPEEDWNLGDSRPAEWEPVKAEPVSEPEAGKELEEEDRDAAESETGKWEPEKRQKQWKPEAPRQKPRPSFWSRFRPKHIWRKIRVTFQKICGKLKILMEKWQQLLDFLGQEENKQTFRNLKSQMLALFRHIRPRKITGRLRFGFEDPSKTGQVLACVSPFYGLYAKGFTLIPVFEEEVMEGELDIKGRIRLAALIWIGIKVIRDKNFRTLLKKWKAV